MSILQCCENSPDALYWCVGGTRIGDSDEDLSGSISLPAHSDLSGNSRICNSRDGTLGSELVASDSV
jgi:hypothetical protein